MKALTQKEMQLISGCALFAGLSERDLLFALSSLDARRCVYKKGEYVKRPDEPMCSFGLVLWGSVQVYLDDADGNQTMMNSVAAGESYGESLSFLGVSDAPIYATVQEETAVLHMNAAAFRDITAASDARLIRLYHRFVSMLASRTLAMNERIQILSKKNLRERLCFFFGECRRRYGDHFTLPMDRERLAVYLGVNRSALSRELSKMQGEGLFTYRKNTFKFS